MKPNSIVQFERLYLASIVVWLINTSLAFNQNAAGLKAMAGEVGFGAGALIGTTLAMCAIAAGIWYLVVKGRSVIAKWVLSLWFLVNTCLLALGLFVGGVVISVATVLNWVGYGLGAWALSYLFKPDAEAWFAKSTPSA